MRYIKPYQIFEASASAPALTAEQIEWLDECAAGRWKLNTSTGLIDVNGNFDCKGQGLTDFKGVKFRKVSKDFDCSDNQLTTLEGTPQSVGRDFDCSYNQLTTLGGAPKTVGGNFWCSDNQLTTLEGAPQTVDGSFICSDNQLTSLEGAPRKVDGGFGCEGNPVSVSTLRAIFALTKKGNSYQQAAFGYLPEMPDEDRALIQMTNLSPEDVRKYNALINLGNIKGYL
jgi:hypothetical protein